MTEKLFYKDAYMTTFEAVVTETADKKGTPLAAFDRTAFYPEGGGQPADHGILRLADGREILVNDVHEQDGIVWHYLSEPLCAGEQVTGEIDWARRFDHMQQHSGEHIVSGMICAAFDCDNVGFHLGEDVIEIDYNARISYEQALEIEAAANKYIWENHEFIQQWPTEEELKNINYRSKKELSGAVRITSFPGADICACCGTHVARSGEVGLVKFASARNFHDGTRLELYCGKRAMEFLSAAREANKQVAVLLSTGEEETARVVQKQLDDFAGLKAELSALEDDYFRLYAESLAGTENAVIVSEKLGPDQGRKLADALADKCSGTTAVFTAAGPAAENGEKIYRYAMINRTADIAGLVKEMNASLHGKGGGRAGFAQGTLTATAEAIEKFFGK